MTGEARPRAAGRRPGVGDVAHRYALVAVWMVVIAVFGALRPEVFLTTANLQAILGSQAVLVVVTLGLVVPLTAGDYDLSVGAVLSLSAMAVALLDVEHGWPVGGAIAAGVACGGLVGALNGVLVVLLRLDPFVTTLGTATFVAGVVLWVSGSQTIGGISPGLVEAVVVDEVLGIPPAFFYGLVLCAAVGYVFEHTVVGRRLLFVGQGRSVARLSGVRVGRIRFGAFVASAMLSAGAGVLYAGTTGGADPSSGANFLLPAFAGAFLGATAIRPGRFNPWGSFVAVYFLATGITGLQLLGAESFVQQLFYGAALVLAVALSRLAGGRAGDEEA